MTEYWYCWIDYYYIRWYQVLFEKRTSKTMNLLWTLHNNCQVCGVDHLRAAPLAAAAGRLRRRTCPCAAAATSNRNSDPASSGGVSTRRVISLGDSIWQWIKASDVHKVLHMTLQSSSANRTKNWVEENTGHTVVCYSHTVGLATALN